MDVKKILKDHETKFLTFTWATYYREVGETSVYMNWWPLVGDCIFPDPATDYINRHMGSAKSILARPAKVAASTSLSPIVGAD